MSEHLALPSHQHQHSHLPWHPRPRGNPDPLTSVWIRRLHLTPNPPPPPLQDAVSTDKSRTQAPPPPRSGGFGPFRWSPRPLRGAPVGPWDSATAASGSGDGPPMLLPFFRLPAPPPPPVADIGEFAPFRPMIGLGSSSGSGGFTGLSSRMVVGGDANAAWLSTSAAGAAYPSHDVDMVPIRTIHRTNQHGQKKLIRDSSTPIFPTTPQDLHDRQHSMIPQNFARRAPSSSSQHDEPFSYWNMGRSRRNTTTSSISPIAVAPGNFGKKRNADFNSFLPLKFRKLSGAL